MGDEAFRALFSPDERLNEVQMALRAAEDTTDNESMPEIDIEVNLRFDIHFYI